MPNRRRSLHRWSWGLAAVALVGAGIFLKWRLASASANEETTAWTAVPRPARTAPALDASHVPPRLADAMAPSAGAAPAGLTEDQWQTLQQRVEPGPQHDRELARIVDFLEFQRRVVALRESRGDAGAAARRRLLAAQIESGIATHLALREISGPEATLLEAAALDEIEPDPARRAQRLADWGRDWTNAHPPESDPRVAEYQRREAATVAAWQSGPASQRDPAQLARRLQQLQSAVFDPQP
jgi:hypothetical protein